MNRLIAEYGLALVFANVLLEQLGLPIPAVPYSASPSSRA